MSGSHHFTESYRDNRQVGFRGWTDQADPVECYELRRAVRACPYRMLWLAVLHRAMCDAIDPRSTGGGDTPAIQQYYARQWFRSKKYDVGSFRWIIDELDIIDGELEYLTKEVWGANQLSKGRGRNTIVNRVVGPRNVSR